MKQDYQFFLGEVEGLGFLAATSASAEHLPFHFCVHGNTEKQAVNNACAAIEFYNSYVNRDDTETSLKVSEKRRVPFKSLEQVFIPSDVVFAVAC